MKKLLLLLILCCLLGGCDAQEVPETTLPPQTHTEYAAPMEETATLPPAVCLPEPEDGDFVKICDYIPTARQELRYATEQNFTGQVIYEFDDAWLRYGTVKKMQAVSQDLEELGLYLKIWDGFRPVSAQFVLWEVCPNPTYVANPNGGFSSHSRGNTVDVTVVDANGEELEMPTGFDDFSAKADRDYTDCTDAAANNAQILELLMEKHGFQGYFGEWWHFSDMDVYPVEQEFDPAEEA